MIDGGMFIGRNPINGNTLTREQCIKWMNDQNIDCAIVSNYKSIFYDYREGNAELLEFARKYPKRIIPSIVVSLNGINISEASEYLDEVIQLGARVLGIYKTPKYYDVSLNSRLLRQVVDIASKKGMIIQFGLESTSDLEELCSSHWDLDTDVLVRWMNGRGYFNIAETLAVLKEKENYYFDIGAINNCRGIQYLLNNIKSEKFYWASGKPECFFNTSRYLLQSEELEAEDAHNIYAGTLQEILGINSKDITLAISEPKKWSELVSRPKVDTHWHYHGWNLLDKQDDVDELKLVVEKYSFEKIIISSSLALNYDFQIGNAELSEILEADTSGKLYGYIVVDPTRPDESLREIELYREHPRFVGLKTIQDLYNMRLDDPQYEKILAKGEKYGMTMLAHIPGMKEAAIKHPGMNFISAHSTWVRVRHMVGITNIYFDLCSSHNDWAETQLEKLIENAGVEKILFGSDAQLISPAWTLGKISEYSFDEDVLESVLKNNAYKLLPKLKG